MPADQPKELVIAAGHVDPTPNVTERPRCDKQSRLPRPSERARGRQQVERHGEPHRGRDSDRHHLEEEAVSPPIPAGEGAGERRRRSPSPPPPRLQPSAILA